MKNVSDTAIEILIRARYPLVYVVSFEEERVKAGLKRIALDRQKQLYSWTITNGLELGDGTFISELKDPIKVLEYGIQSDVNGIFILSDYHHYLTDPVVVRKLKDAARILKTTKKNIILLSSVLKVPQELEKEMSVIDYQLPGRDEIACIVDGIAGNIGNHAVLPVMKDTAMKQKVIDAAMGLTASEAENVFAKSLVEKGDFDLKIILSEKEQIIRKSGVLEYYHTNENMKEVGGLEELKKWLEKRGKAFTSQARDFGLPEPRGICEIS